jgi:hypothetical protein
MKKNKLALAAAAAGATLFGVIAPSSADAAVIDPGLYVLLNHPSAAPISSGLRLDELYNVDTSRQDIFLFDFEHPQSLVVMEVTPSMIRISGDAFGGYWRIADGYVPGPYRGVYSFDFVYQIVVMGAPGDDDYIVDGPNNANVGSILTPLGHTIPLYDERGGHAFSFRLGNEDNDNGHRGFDGVSGWGWLNHGGNPGVHITVGDWLFTVGPEVPAPGAAVTLLAGLAVLASRRRRSAAAR